MSGTQLARVPTGPLLVWAVLLRRAPADALPPPTHNPSTPPAGCPHQPTTLPPPPRLPQVYDVLNADKIIVEKAALAYLNEWFGAGEQ